MIVPHYIKSQEWLLVVLFNISGPDDGGQFLQAPRRCLNHENIAVQNGHLRYVPMLRYSSNATTIRLRLLSPKRVPTMVETSARSYHTVQAYPQAH